MNNEGCLFACDWMIVSTFMTVLAGCAVNWYMMDHSAKLTQCPPAHPDYSLVFCDINEISRKVNLSPGSLVSETGRVGNKMTSSPLIHTVLTTLTLTGNGFYPHPLQLFFYTWADFCSGDFRTLPVPVRLGRQCVSDQYNFYTDEKWIFPNLYLLPEWENVWAA